jgi:hypothetical protein
MRDNKDGLDDLSAEPVRTCANGELVRPMSIKISAPAPPSAPPFVGSIPRPERSLSIQAGTNGFAPASGVGGPASGFAPAATRTIEGTPR